MATCLAKKGLHESILNMAYERGLEGEDLTYSEILVTLFGCRPARIGPLSVQGFSLEELIGVCRKQDYSDFHFGSDAEQKAYSSGNQAAFEAVADLEEKGWVKIVIQDQLIWDENQPRVKSLEKNKTVRLTRKGEKLLRESKNPKFVFSHKCPA